MTRFTGGDKSSIAARIASSNDTALSPSEDRWRERSRTYPGIAAAMAAQWGEAS